MTRATTITAQPGLPFVDLVREFDAPAAAVFRAHTDPKLFVQWNGPRSITTNIHEYDATPGGRWRYTIPGEGVVCWQYVMNRLSDFGYGGIMSVELEDHHYWQSVELQQLGMTRALGHLKQYAGRV